MCVAHSGNSCEIIKTAEWFSLTLWGLRSEIWDQYGGQGCAELQELSHCSLSQHRKGKVSYCDLYPVIVLTHSQVIYMSFGLLRGLHDCPQCKAAITSLSRSGNRKKTQRREWTKKAIIDKLCSIGHCCNKAVWEWTDSGDKFLDQSMFIFSNHAKTSCSAWCTTCSKNNTTWFRD